MNLIKPARRQALRLSLQWGEHHRQAPPQGGIAVQHRTGVGRL